MIGPDANNIVLTLSILVKINSPAFQPGLTEEVEASNPVLLERKSSVRVFTLEETTKSQDTPMRQKSNKHGGHFYFSYLSITLFIFQFQLHLSVTGCISRPIL